MHSTLHLTIAFLLLLQSPTVNGQGGSEAVPFAAHRGFRTLYFAEPSDSSAFQQFIQSLRTDAGPPHAGGTPKRYRQAWLVSEHGGFAIVSRGDGQVITLEAEPPALDSFDRMFIHMRTTDDRTCVAEFWERPCAMICRTTTYYLEE